MSRNTRVPKLPDHVVHPEDQRPLRGKGGQLAGSSTGSDWSTILKYRQAKGRIDFPGPAGNVDIRICSWWSCDHPWTASTGLAIQIYARNGQGRAKGGGVNSAGVKNPRAWFRADQSRILTFPS